MPELRQLGEMVCPVLDKAFTLKDETLPYIGLEHLGRSELIGSLPSSASISVNTIFKSGDVLFGKLRPNLRKCASAPFDGYCSTDVLVLRAKEGISHRFASRVFQTEHVGAMAERTAAGTKMPRTSWKEIRSLESFTPNRKEQETIADVLDTLDATIRQTEAIIEKLKQVKQGLLHDLLTRGIDANGELRPPQSEAPHLYKQSSLGWVPQPWNVAVLNDLVDQKRPIVYGILMPGYGHEGGIPVVKVKDIFGGAIRIDGLLLTSPAIDLEYRRSRLAPGDLLFTIRGSVGRTAFVPQSLEGANITQDTARVSIIGTDPRFVREYFALPIPSRFIKTHTLGVAVQGINLRDVRRIPIAVPPTGEATAIADRIDRNSNRLSAEATTVKKLREMKAGLMDDLLTGRVRVTPLLEAATA